MKCSEYQQRIVESGNTGQESEELKNHFNECSKCNRFKSEYEAIRTAISPPGPIQLPQALDEQTHAFCLARLNRTHSSLQADPLQKFIPVIASGLIILTIGIMGFAWMQGLHEQHLLLGWLLRGMALQNGLMLLLSPALLRMNFHQWRHSPGKLNTKTTDQVFSLIF